MVAVVAQIITALVSLSAIKDIGKKAVARFFQNLTYEGDNKLFLELDSFQCDGLSKSYFNDEVHIAVPKSIVSELLKLDEYIAKQFKLPEEAPSKWKASKSPYKSLNNSKYDKIYIKLDENIKAFNFERQLLKSPNYDVGEYKLIIRVNGIFIGVHGETEKYASLQLRVTQIMYRPSFEDGCLFSTASMKDTRVMPPSTSAETLPSKPAAQRQTTVILPSNNPRKRKKDENSQKAPSKIHVVDLDADSDE